MTTAVRPDALKYIAVTLGQMANMLRDFEMLEVANLLDAAKVDIEHELARKPKRHATGRPMTDRRGKPD